MAHFPLPEERFALPGRRRRAVAVGVGVMSVALLASVLGARNWSNESTVPMATWGTASGYSSAPDTASPSPAGNASASQPQADGSSPPTPAAFPGVSERGRLRHVATGLCLDIRGGRVVAGAGTRLAACSSAGTQQWSYEYDGLLRSLADPRLCLDSHADDGDVVLSGCVGSDADDVRYDITFQGELVPRRRDDLAVVPVSLRAGADVVVRTRSGSAGEMWTFVSKPSASDDSARAGDPQANGGAAGGGPGQEPKAKGEGGPKGTQPGPKADTGGGTSGSGGSPTPSPEATSEQQFETRYVTDEGGEESAPVPAVALPPQPLGLVEPVVAPVLQTVGSITGAVSALVPR